MRKFTFGVAAIVGIAAALLGAKVAFASAVISSVSPAAAANTGSVRMTINGTGFLPGASVRLIRSGQADIPGDNVVLGTNVAFDSMSRLRASFDLNTRPPGDWNVRITQLDGSATCRECFAVAAEAPTVTSVVPPSRGQGADDQKLTLTGTNFARAASVSISGQGIDLVGSPNFLDTKHLTVVVRVDADAPEDARDVTVTNTDGQAGTCDGCFAVNGAPTVASAAPADRGQGATNQNVVLSGTNFLQGATASFGSGVTVNAVTVQSPESLKANVSLSAVAVPGPRDITVTNGDGGVSARCDDCFTVNAAPAAASVSPGAHGQGVSDQDVTVRGTGFVDGAEVSFSGTGITVNSTTFTPGELTNDLVANISIAATAPAVARDVIVTNPDAGVGICDGCFAVNASPTVYEVDPDSRGQGAAGTVTITGADFAPGATAAFPGSGIAVNSTTFVNAGELRADIAVDPDVTPGPRDVLVKNTDGGAGTCEECFVVNAKPVATSVSPPSRGQRAAEQELVVAGSSFADGADVSFSGTGITVHSVDFVNPTTLKVNVSVSGLASVGERDITVQNPDGGQAATCSDCFTVNAAPTISIPDGLDPSSRGQGANAHDVAILGSGFVPDAAASISGEGITVHSTTYDSAEKLVARVSVDADAPVGPRDVHVVNPDQGSVTCPGCFSVGRAPTVTLVDPNDRGQGAQKQDINIVGEGFVEDTAVSFSGSDMTVNSIDVSSPTSLVANISVGSAAISGRRDIIVSNPDGGTDRCVGCFSVVDGPLVSSVSPDALNRGAANRTLSITGSGFNSDTALDLADGVSLNSLTYVSPASLTANVSIDPAAAVGPRDVVAVNRDGGRLACDECLTIGDGPAVNSTTPTAALNSGPKTITVKGFGFTPGSDVRLRRSGRPDVVGSDVTVSSATQLKATFDLTWLPPGVWSVLVTAADGDSDLCRCFSVAQGAPTLTSVVPGELPQGASERTITLRGTSFAPGAEMSISWTGISIESQDVTSPTELTAVVSVDPDAPAGSRDVTVTNTDGQESTCTDCLTVNLRPLISSVSAPDRRQGAQDQDMTILGNYFDPDADVSVSGSGVTVNSVEFTPSDIYNPYDQLVANFSIASGAAIGPRSVTVTNPDSGSATCARCFTVTSSPSIESVSPASLAQGALEHDLTLTGTNLVEGAVVSFSGSGVAVNSSLVETATSLLANVSVGSGAATGPRDVTVTNPDEGKATCAGCFTVNAAPTLTSLSPAARAAGASDQDVTLAGTNFADGAEVSVSGSGVTVNAVDVQSPTSLLANLSVAPDAAPGARDVTVTNPDAGETVCNNCFTVNVPPTLTSLSPASSGRGATGHTITLVGTDFADGASVSVPDAGVTVDSTQVVNATTLTAAFDIADDAALGSHDVIVTNADAGTATCADCFSITGAQGRYTPLVPARVLDTRGTNGGHNGKAAQGEAFDVLVTGRGGVPANGVSAVALNVTATQPTTAGSFTVYPAGAARPAGSNVNFATGETVANLVVVKVGEAGKVTLFNSRGQSHAIFDVQGWYGNQPEGSSGRFQSLTPDRIVDTRNGIGGRKAKLDAGKTMDVQVTGRGGVPSAGVSSVVVNVTATNPTASSYLTVYPTGTTRPGSSNLNYPAGRTVSNRVVAKVSDAGKVTLYNNAGSTDVVMDVNGWFTGSSTAGEPGSYVPLAAGRVLDTRSGVGAPKAKLGAGRSIEVQLMGEGDVPASDVAAVVVNFTAVNPSRNTYLTVYPAGGAKPPSADLNPYAGRTMSNLVMVKVGDGGKVKIYNNAGETDVTMEVLGYYVAP